MSGINVCACCGEIWPSMFMAPTAVWCYIIPPDLRRHIVCIRCYYEFAKIRHNLDSPDTPIEPIELNWIDEKLKPHDYIPGLVEGELAWRQTDDPYLVDRLPECLPPALKEMIKDDEDPEPV
jgi:hypothetical protein